MSGRTSASPRHSHAFRRGQSSCSPARTGAMSGWGDIPVPNGHSTAEAMTPRHPRYGLSLPNRGVLFGATSVDELLEISERGEASGAFDSIWVGDSLFIKPRLESLMLLSAIAARTRRVRLGTCCLSTFTLRDPILLAAQWAALDQIAHGRAVLGACIGGALPREKAEAEFAAFGVKLAERGPRLEEGIAILR